ncbi:hypothetical protein PQX77_009012 [Marasmius sp. AFHP31]|nr:hypothetical protein PQX77_009012 [Marasmius sp. AFHP31]
MHSQSPFQTSPTAQSHPFSTSSGSPFQLRPVSPHPHYPQLPPHPQPSPERRFKTEIERERAFDRRDRDHDRVDVLMRDDRGYGGRGDKGAPRESNFREGRTEHFPRDEKELRERIDRERRDIYQRDGRREERERDSRRPLSPSSLRDVNLPAPKSPSSPLDMNPSSPALHPRDPDSKLPAPPTGHDLMALFPAPSPYLVPFSGKQPPDAQPSQPRHESTSGYFQRQERAFFAQAGREIVRVRLEIDSVGGDKSPHMYHPHSSPDSPRYQLPPHPHHPHALSPGGAITPPPGSTEGLRSSVGSDGMEGIEGPDDESWRRPMPYAERRRAGKHTRRVVRN